MKHKIKMIGMDLDGTLLTSDKRVTDYTKKVLEQALAQGIVVLVSTGRPFTAVPKEALNIAGMKYAVTTNGARILDIEKNETIYESTLPIETSRKLLNIIYDYDAVTEIFIEGVSYSRKLSSEELQAYFKDPHMVEYFMNTRVHVDDLQKLLQEEPAKLEKVHAIFKWRNEMREAYERLVQVPDIEIVSSFGDNWEINKAGTNKGEALIRLGELLGIQREEIMACGDSMNDYAMIKAVGFGVAMGNADEEVKEIADYITLSNDEDGVAKAIEKFALQDEGK